MPSSMSVRRWLLLGDIQFVVDEWHGLIDILIGKISSEVVDLAFLSDLCGDTPCERLVLQGVGYRAARDRRVVCGLSSRWCDRDGLCTVSSHVVMTSRFIAWTEVEVAGDITESVFHHSNVNKCREVLVFSVK
ncbi:hypothetical protein KC19_9G091500 [Ceratodon purpureus]|uniref:Uncharacterized protein n=1 Tax=Ceratodon purpureus TaxID=3225 RepID=A0A8T0GS82_CERPU|nr:hypothetical protein KC19_9G091500 [Ceratodon purpureus]